MLHSLGISIDSSNFNIVDLKAHSGWQQVSACNMARLSWTSMDNKKTYSFLSLNNGIIHRTMVILVMGHCHFGRRAKRLDIAINDFCRSCGSEDEKETFFHLMCQQYPAIVVKRRRFLISYFLTWQLSNIKIVAIHTYIHNWSLQHFSHDYKLASYNTYVVCVHFIHEWRDLQFEVEFAWQIYLFIRRVFPQKSAARNSPKKYFFFSYFV